MDSRALLIGNSRWHWATQRGERWSFDHAAPDPRWIDTTNLIWAAVGEVPAALEGAQESRLQLENVPLEGCPPWLGVDRALGAWGAWRRQRSQGGGLDQGLLLADADGDGDGDSASGAIANTICDISSSTRNDFTITVVGDQGRFELRAEPATGAHSDTLTLDHLGRQSWFDDE